MPSQPQVQEKPHYQEPVYAEPPRYQEPAHSEPPRQARAQHPAADRYALEEDPTATRQIARPVSRPKLAEEVEEAPRRREARAEEAPPKKKGLFSRLLEVGSDQTPIFSFFGISDAPRGYVLDLNPEYWNLDVVVFRGCHAIIVQ